MIRNFSDRETHLVWQGTGSRHLPADRKGQHSIRINDQWRICFLWKDRDAFNVAIVDYH